MFIDVDVRQSFLFYNTQGYNKDSAIARGKLLNKMLYAIYILFQFIKSIKLNLSF